MNDDYLKVRAGFIAQGISFNRWCRQNGVLRENARKAMLGQWAGPKGREVRQRLLREAGVAIRP
ncbi:MAG: hypothetical protein F9K25_14305 [Candidatus Contendobacter sp.]|nr:MAG: hypothetical protein F9K25_14305 [Candidatus Contendobacter sp.]